LYCDPIETALIHRHNTSDSIPAERIAWGQSIRIKRPGSFPKTPPKFVTRAELFRFSAHQDLALTNLQHLVEASSNSVLDDGCSSNNNNDNNYFLKQKLLLSSSIRSDQTEYYRDYYYFCYYYS
jgi:hypothetical protein